MHSDTFTKIILVVIALCLGIIAFSLVLRTESTQAQGRINFDKIRFTNTQGGFLIMDTRTGNVWMYTFGDRSPDFIGRLVQVGQPLLTARTR
jgi:hypothetical protein